MVGPAHPLEERGDAVRRADLAHELDGPDVDAKLQRRRRHQRPQLAGAQAVLDALAALPGERSVVRRDLVLAEPLTELVGDPLRERPGVDEYQRCPVAARRGAAMTSRISLIWSAEITASSSPSGSSSESSSARLWPLSTTAGSGSVAAHQQPRRGLHRPDRRREADPNRPALRHSAETFERERQMRAALVPGQGVDLVDDHRLHRRSVARDRSAVRYR